MIAVEGEANDTKYHNRTLYVGPEHPVLETFAISLAKTIRARKVLEVGYQCGALSFALVEHLARNNEHWSYYGIDIEEIYANELCYASSLVPEMLDRMGINHGGRLRFYWGDARQIVPKLADIEKVPFDLVLIDHDKPLYLTCYESLLDSGLIAPNAPVVFHDIYTYAKVEWRYICNKFSDHIIFESLVGRSGDIGVIWRH